MNYTAPHAPINLSEALEARLYTAKSGFTLPYRLFVPEGYTPAHAYPLLVFLHGAGERGCDNTAQLKHMISALFRDTASPIYGAIVICPQCPAGQQWVNTPWAQGSYVLDNIPESDGLSAVVQLIAAIRGEFAVDEKRIYAMGISMGGFGTWDLLMRHTELFAAAVPVCGAADPSRAESLKNMPIRTFHGLCDAVVPSHGTAKMATALKAAGCADFAVEYPEEWDHNVWDYVAAKAGLMDWLFAQSR